MSAPTPLVTVVMPSFNEDVLIMRASIESIRAQTFANFECIVVDESTRPELADACQAICAEDPRFIYMHPTERLGLSRSLNLAISNARGRLIARFDSDDICMPERLEVQVSFLRAHPEISAVGGAMDVISSGGKFLAHRSYPLTSEKIAKAMQFTNAIAHPTVMFRREVIDLYGGYNPNYRYCEDLDLWLRWINAGVLLNNLPYVLVQYRQNNTRRDHLNWKYNLRARISNFSTRHLVRRIIGIVCIATWMAVPGKLQEYIYKVVLLHRRSRGVTN
jgi:glycosyltransferase involved in cell wall biosynthesis